MPIEHASVQVARKPWGVADLRPWSSIDGSGDAIGIIEENKPVVLALAQALIDHPEQQRDRWGDREDART